MPIASGMRLALQAANENVETLPDKVCSNCYDALATKVSKGTKLRIEREAREKNKVLMWKNRVNLIKEAREFMAQRAYSQAAVCYEKYLRVLELVFNVRKGELTPKVFNNSTRSKEITVIATVYWDLMRIYDTSPRYGERMAHAAAQLAQFLPYSTVYTDIITKAEAFSRSARNPSTVRQFLKLSRKVRGPCFIATATLGESSDEVACLRLYRDHILRPSCFGRLLIGLYYLCSPPFARWIVRSPQLKSWALPGIHLLALHARKTLNSRQTSTNAKFYEKG